MDTCSFIVLAGCIFCFGLILGSAITNDARNKIKTFRNHDNLLMAIITMTKAHQAKNVIDDSTICRSLNTVLTLMDAGIDNENVLIAALFHASNDRKNGVKYGGVPVLNILKEISNDTSLSTMIRQKLQIRDVGRLSMDARLIVMADTLVQLSSLNREYPNGWTPDMVKGYRVWAYCLVKNIWSINDKLKFALTQVFRCKNVFNDNIDHELEAYYELLERTE